MNNNNKTIFVISAFIIVMLSIVTVLTAGLVTNSKTTLEETELITTINNSLELEDGYNLDSNYVSNLVTELNVKFPKSVDLDYINRKFKDNYVTNYNSLVSLIATRRRIDSIDVLMNKMR